MKPLYDGDAKLIGHYHFTPQYDEYTIRFYADNSHLDTIMSVDAFTMYCEQFGYYTETEIWELKLG